MNWDQINMGVLLIIVSAIVASVHSCGFDKETSAIPTKLEVIDIQREVISVEIVK